MTSRRLGAIFLAGNCVLIREVGMGMNPADLHPRCEDIEIAMEQRGRSSNAVRAMTEF
jgi:hypothetical protein